MFLSKFKLGLYGISLLGGPEEHPWDDWRSKEEGRHQRHAKLLSHQSFRPHWGAASELPCGAQHNYMKQNQGGNPSCLGAAALSQGTARQGEIKGNCRQSG